MRKLPTRRVTRYENSPTRRVTPVISEIKLSMGSGASVPWENPIYPNPLHHLLRVAFYAHRLPQSRFSLQVIATTDTAPSPSYERSSNVMKC